VRRSISTAEARGYITPALFLPSPNDNQFLFFLKKRQGFLSQKMRFLKKNQMKYSKKKNQMTTSFFFIKTDMVSCLKKCGFSKRTCQGPQNAA
jgi:hypothetical protein